MKDDSGSLVLQRDGARVALAPGHGGAVHEFKWRGRDVFRPTPPGLGADPLDTSCFPMVPYVNRVAHGRFEFAGRSIRLERNWDKDPHPLHGQGWRGSWDVVTHSDTRALLRFEGGADEWPWRYRSEQLFELQPDGLSIELMVENLSEAPMPAMLGLHPYFADTEHARIEAELPRVWLTDGGALPVEEVPTPPAWNFAAGRAVREVALDHGFVGWTGAALLRWPDRTVTLTAPECRFLHLYTPKSRGFFCVEPQNAAPGALGRGEAAVIAPGLRANIRARFAVGAS